MPKKMLIDATHPEETRVVVVDGNKVEDFDFESVNKRQLAGNIYLAKVTRVEPSLQAAFVEYGGNRHGFLAFPEIHPDYYQIPVADREALLAEEASDEAAERARDEDAERKPRRARRERGQATSKPRSRRAAGSGRGTVSGLEVIEVDGPDGRDLPAGLQVAEPDAGADAAAEAALETAAFPDAVDVPEAARPGGGTRHAAGQAEAAPEAPGDIAGGGTAGGETAGGETDAEPAGPDHAAVPADDADTRRDGGPRPEGSPAGSPAGSSEGPEDDAAAGSDETPPRSIAESAGLDDGDRLTEEIDADAPAPAEPRTEAAGGPEDVAVDGEGAVTAAAETLAAPSETPVEDAAGDGTKIRAATRVDAGAGAAVAATTRPSRPSRLPPARRRTGRPARCRRRARTAMARPRKSSSPSRSAPRTRSRKRPAPVRGCAATTRSRTSSRSGRSCWSRSSRRSAATRVRR